MMVSEGLSASLKRLSMTRFGLKYGALAAKMLVPVVTKVETLQGSKFGLSWLLPSLVGPVSSLRTRPRVGAGFPGNPEQLRSSAAFRFLCKALF